MNSPLSLPELSPDAQALIRAAKDYAINGVQSDLLPTSLPDEFCFKEPELQTRNDLFTFSNADLVGCVLRNATTNILNEHTSSNVISDVAVPSAYIDLLKVGSKIQSNRSLQRIAQLPNRIQAEHYQVARSTYSSVGYIFEDRNAWKALKQMQPALAQDETLEDRLAQNKKGKAKHDLIVSSGVATAAYSGVILNANLSHHMIDRPLIGIVATFAVCKAYQSAHILSSSHN